MTTLSRELAPSDEAPASGGSSTRRLGLAFQARVKPWLDACFGPEIAGDRAERNHRFIEEALELVQSTGCTRSEAHQLVDYVFSRPVGDPRQEVGGVKVTLAALCLAHGMDMHEAGEVELARVWTKVEQIRAKQAAKPKHSPLPEHVDAPADQGATAALVARAEKAEWERDEMCREHTDMMWQRRRADERAQDAEARAGRLAEELREAAKTLMAARLHVADELSKSILHDAAVRADRAALAPASPQAPAERTGVGIKRVQIEEALDYASDYGAFNESTPDGEMSSSGGVPMGIERRTAIVAYKKLLGLLPADYPMPLAVSPMPPSPDPAAPSIDAEKTQPATDDELRRAITEVVFQAKGQAIKAMALQLTTEERVEWRTKAYHDACDACEEACRKLFELVTTRGPSLDVESLREELKAQAFDEAAKIVDRHVDEARELNAAGEVSREAAGLCILTSRAIAKDIRARAALARRPADGEAGPDFDDGGPYYGMADGEAGR